MSYCDLEVLSQMEEIWPNRIRNHILSHFWSSNSLADILQQHPRLVNLELDSHNYQQLKDFANNNDNHEGDTVRPCRCGYMFLDLPENVYDCDYCCDIICCLKCNPKKMTQVANRWTESEEGDHLCSKCSNE